MSAQASRPVALRGACASIRDRARSAIATAVNALGDAPLLLLVVPFVLRLGEASRVGGFEHIVLPQECAALVVAALLCVWALLRRAALPRTRLGLCLLALAALEALSVVCASNPFIGVRVWSLTLAAIAVFSVGRALGRLSFWCTLPVFIVAGSVVLEAARIVPRMSALGHAPGGVLGERNLAAEFLVCALPLLATFALDSRKLRVGLALGGVALSTTAIICCRTRGAWLGLAVLAIWGLVLAVFWGCGRTRKLQCTLLVSAALCGVFAAPFVSHLHWRTPTPFVDTMTHLVDTDSGSGQGRLVQYRTTLEMALSHPVLGVGPGNWAGSYPSFAAPDDPTVGRGLWPVTRLPNSDLLGFIAERGFGIALLGAVALGLLCCPGSKTHLRRSLLLGWAVVGTLDAVFQLPGPLLWFAFVLGASGVEAVSRADALRPTPRPWLGMGLALAALSVFAFWRVSAFQLALHPRGTQQLERATELDPGHLALRLRTAYDWSEQKRCELALPHLAMVARASPRHPALLPLLERCPAAE